MSRNKINSSIKTFNTLQESLKGISELFNLNLNKDDFLFLAAMDNLEALAENIPKLFENLDKTNGTIIEKLEQLTVGARQNTKNTEITK